MTVLKILKSLWLKIRPYTSKRCCAVFLFIWDLLIQNPLQFLRNLNTGELWLQKSGKIVLFCLFYLLSRTNKTNRTAAHKFKSLLLRQQKRNFCLPKVPFLFIHCESNGISSDPWSGYHRRRRISSAAGCILFRIDDISQQVADDIHGLAAHTFPCGLMNKMPRGRYRCFVFLTAQ